MFGEGLSDYYPDVLGKCSRLSRNCPILEISAFHDDQKQQQAQQLQQMQIKSSELLEAGMNHEGLQLNDEMLDTDLPKLSFAKHRWNHEMIVLTPWLTTEPPILTQFRNTLRARNSPKQRGAYSSNSKAKILPRQVQLNHEEYKMNKTLVEFRIKPTLPQSRKKRSCPDQLESLSAEKRERERRSPEANRKNITVCPSFFEKTPKMIFLQRKMKVKEALSSTLRRRRGNPVQYENSSEDLDSISRKTNGRLGLGDNCKKCETFNVRRSKKKGSSKMYEMATLEL